MIKAIIVDDSLDDRRKLNEKLKEAGISTQLEIVAESDSVISAIEAILRLKPDLVFLDVEMPDGSGFDVLNKLKERNFDVIFTTAYDQHAIEAIRFSALDYLIKPIDEKLLMSAIARFEEKKLKLENNNEIRFRSLFQNLNNPNDPNNLITIPHQNGFAGVKVNEIVRCQADGNYTYIILISKAEILSAKTLQDYEDLLDKYNFVRVHRSHLINIQHFKDYTRGDGGIIKMADGKEVDVSRSGKEKFLNRLKEL